MQKNKLTKKSLLIITSLSLLFLISLKRTKIFAYEAECEIGETATWSCGSGGCAEDEFRQCRCGLDNRWGSCSCIASSDCPADGEEGTGGGTGGGEPGCTPIDPSGFRLTSPANNSYIENNDVFLRWRDVADWGRGCPTNPRFFIRMGKLPNRGMPCRDQDNDAFYNLVYRSQRIITPANPPITNEPTIDPVNHVQINNLAWGGTYCWFVEANNNGGSRDSRDVWKFTIYNTPSFEDFNFAFTESCGNGISGQASNDGTDNPITFYTEYSLNDNGVGEEGITQVVTAISPDIYSSASIISEEVLAETSQDYFMALATINHTNPEQSEFQIVNSDSYPYYSGTQTSGSLTNSSNTATLMNINDTVDPESTHVEIIDANTIRVYWQVRFEDNYKYKTDGTLFDNVIQNNIYGAALREVFPGEWNSSTGSRTLGRSLGLLENWGVNVQPPKAIISDPQVLNSTDFNLDWDVQAYGLQKAEGYMWTSEEPLDITKISPAPILSINLTTSEPDTTVNPKPNSNVGVYYRSASADTLGIHTYRLTDTTRIEDTINTKMYAKDTACNEISDSGSALDLTGSWMMTAGGDIHATNFSTQLREASLTGDLEYLNNFSFLSTYTSAVSDAALVTSSRISKQNYLLERYDDWNSSPPRISDKTSWYDYLLDLVTKNSTITIAPSSQINKGQKTSQFLSGAKTQIETSGNFSVEEGAICDTRTIFFIQGDLTIHPDFTIQNSETEQMGCIFIVKGNIRIESGSFKNGYDKIQAFLITDGDLNTDVDNMGTNYDGLYLQGGVYTQGNNNLHRSFSMLDNYVNPAEIFEFDPRYTNIFQEELNIKDYSIREKGYIEKINKK